MFRIDSNGAIRLSRGDNCTFTLFLNAGTKMTPIRYSFQTTDILRFYLVPVNKPFEDRVLQKDFTYEDLNDNGDIEGYLESADTINLEEGRYSYTVRLFKTQTNE